MGRNLFGSLTQSMNTTETIFMKIALVREKKNTFCDSLYQISQNRGKRFSRLTLSHKQQNGLQPDKYSDDIYLLRHEKGFSVRRPFPRP